MTSSGDRGGSDDRLSQIDNLTSTELQGFSTTQFAAVTATQIGGLGRRRSFDNPARRRPLTALTTTQACRCITTTQLNALSTTSLDALNVVNLSTAQVSGLTSTTFNTLLTTQITGLTTAQAQSLTTTTLNALSTTSIDAAVNAREAHDERRSRV